MADAKNSKKGLGWFWNVLVVIFLIISIIEITAFKQNNTSTFEKGFWYFNLVFWGVATILMITVTIKKKKEGKH